MNKRFLQYAFLLVLFTCLLNAQSSESWKIYNDNTVARIDITIDTEALDWIYNNVESDSLHLASMHFKNSHIDEIIENIGFRLRGNTSRHSLKKSFKISFNEFVDGRDFYGVDKLNLNGEHNDPSIIRSKLCWDLYQDIGMIATRAGYSEVYINDEYYGLYINVEHIDSDFIKKQFENYSGNLWKCLYPADLTYLGTNPDLYKFIEEGRRTYELKTNEEEDDYSKLAEFIDVLYNTTISELPKEIEKIFDPASFLKYYAFNFLTGNWDDYHSLMNNYYLYHDPIKDIITFIPYDYDNNLGITWADVDWADTNPYNIPKVVSGPRPLSERFLAVPEYRNLYTHFIEELSSNVINIEEMGNRIDSIKSLIRPSAIADSFRTLDYNFSENDFDLSYISGNYSNQHVKYGLKQFINKKNSSVMNKTNYVNAKPFVYQINVSDLTPNAEDTITVTAAIFSHSPLEEVVIDYYDEISFESLPINMEYKPLSDSKIIEERDRWIGKIPPLGENGKGHFTIRVKSQNQLSEEYPRVNPIEIQVNTPTNFSLFVNELMADNDNIIQDEAGDYDDWIELYNDSSEEIDLSGYFLTDKKNNLTKWEIPNGTVINTKEYLLFWCDEDSEQGSLHTNFKLSASGEYIALVQPDGTTIVDSVSFGEQTTDLSFARIPDGANNWEISNPTPGTSNIYVDDVESDIVVESFALGAYPNPFNPTTTIQYTIPTSEKVSLKVYDVLGNEVSELVNEFKNSGTYKIEFDASFLASGVYLYRLQTGKSSLTKKIILLK